VKVLWCLNSHLVWLVLEASIPTWQSTSQGVLGSIPGNCRPFHFLLFSPLNFLVANEMEKLVHLCVVYVYLWPGIRTTIYIHVVRVKLLSVCMTDQCPKKGVFVNAWSPTVEHVLQPMPCLISCTGPTSI